MKTNTDYANNKKNPDAIIYTFADGTTTILTKADFDSEEEFLKWKAISDKSLHEIEKSDDYYRKMTCSLSAMNDRGIDIGKEDTYFADEIEAEQMQFVKKVKDAISHCTETQQKRLWKYANGATYEDIAKEEGVNVRAVFESIEYGKRNFKKNF